MNLCGASSGRCSQIKMRSSNINGILIVRGKFKDRNNGKSAPMKTEAQLGVIAFPMPPRAHQGLPGSTRS